MSGREAPPAVPEDFSEFIRSAGATAKRYVDKERRYVELLASERAGRLAGTLGVVVLGLILLNWAILLGLIAGAKAFSKWLGSEVQGYLAMSGSVLLLVVVLLLVMRPLRRSLKVRMVNILLGHA